MTDVVIKSSTDFHITYGIFFKNGDNATIYKDMFRL